MDIPPGRWTVSLKFLTQLKLMLPLIFTTAYGPIALKAFKLNSSIIIKTH